MVDKRGRLFVIGEIDPQFVENNVNTELYGEYAGRFVKNAYDPSLTENDATLDIDIAVMLKKKTKRLKLKSTNTVTRIAGAPTNRYCTYRWIPGLSRQQPYANA